MAQLERIFVYKCCFCAKFTDFVYKWNMRVLGIFTSFVNINLDELLVNYN